MEMSTLVDLVVVGLLILSAVVGWRIGMLASALSFGALIAGAWLAATNVPVLLDALGLEGLTRSVTAIAIIVLVALGSQALASYLGGLIRQRMTFTPVAVLDSAGGAVIGVACATAMCVLALSARAMIPDRNLVTGIRSSAVMQTLDRLIPEQLRYTTADVEALVRSPRFPRVFNELRDPIPKVAPPAKSVAGTQAAAMEDYIFRVTSESDECVEQMVGSGFVVSSKHVMTNAHVVAGADEVTVRQGTGKTILDAAVVYFDPAVDVAILYVPALEQRPVSWDQTVKTGESAVIAGYPGGGPLAFKPARISGQVTAKGEDIYGSDAPTRSVWAFRGDVRHGNSGGPLLTRDGRAMALIFASSDNAEQVGYAVPQAQLGKALMAAQEGRKPVPTGTCRTR